MDYDYMKKKLFQGEFSRCSLHPPEVGSLDMFKCALISSRHLFDIKMQNQVLHPSDFYQK